MAAELKLTKITPTTGNTIDIEGNLIIGTDAEPKSIEVKGNLTIDADLIVGTDVLEVDTSSGKVLTKGLMVINDEGVGATGVLTLTNVKDDSLSTGTGTIKLKGSGTTQDSAGFIKMYIGTTIIYIPYFTDITGS